MRTEGDRTVGTPVQARAGFLDKPTLVVLVLSTCLVIAVFSTVYLSFFVG
jgi:hypothetical protein